MEEFKNKVIQGDCLIKLKELEDNSVDSIVTDPPYELGFMGKSWDNTGIANNKELWKECLRVLKPGGHLLAFSGTRTYHRMASAIEDAGFEVRDMIEWIYGSGFPKSLNIAKMLDKMEGVEHPKNTPISDNGSMSGANYTRNKMDVQSDLAKQWEGWGTALKPAHEPICMARKPLAEKTVAENVLKYGTGGINIDESRVGTTEDLSINGNRNNVKSHWGNSEGGSNVESSPLGRFPANLVLEDCEEVRECFPETGASKSANRGLQHSGRHGGLADIGGNIKDGTDTIRGHDDNGGNASRFFKSIIYQAKASKSERNKGCDDMEAKQYSHDGREKEIENPYQRNKSVATNNHPTVKPIALMEYLIKMVTKPGGIVLDPFAGSGSTLVAAKQNGYQYIGIEMTEEYIPIIEARLLGVENDLFKDTL